MDTLNTAPCVDVLSTDLMNFRNRFQTYLEIVVKLAARLCRSKSVSGSCLTVVYKFYKELTQLCNSPQRRQNHSLLSRFLITHESLHRHRGDLKISAVPRMRLKAWALLSHRCRPPAQAGGHTKLRAMPMPNSCRDALIYQCKEACSMKGKSLGSVR